MCVCVCVCVCSTTKTEMNNSSTPGALRSKRGADREKNRVVHNTDTQYTTQPEHKSQLEDLQYRLVKDRLTCKGGSLENIQVTYTSEHLVNLLILPSLSHVNQGGADEKLFPLFH